jgi:hypothetical protein
MYLKVLVRFVSVAGVDKEPDARGSAAGVGRGAGGGGEAAGAALVLLRIPEECAQVPRGRRGRAPAEGLYLD